MKDDGLKNTMGGISMIDREVARKKIEGIISNETPIKTGKTLPIRKGETFNVYKIPIDLLVPNLLNDRITWKIREYEAVNQRKLDVNDETDVEYLYELLLKEDPLDNNRTLEDLATKGQQEDGVITTDGIIIDGNRRATLLRLLHKGKADKFNQSVENFRYFNAVVLPGTISGSEIRSLETMLQIGVDEKVKYNRICLYIKVDNLLNEGCGYSQIRQYMGLKTEKEAKDMKAIYDVMVTYLDAIGKKDHFSLLDGLEDQFIKIESVFDKLKRGTYDTNWDHTEGDIAEFKTVCFDYMRSKFEGKKFRETLIGNTTKTNGVFIEENVWKEFLSNHENIIDKHGPSTEEDWKMLGKKGKQFEQNLNNTVKKLESTLEDKDLAKLINDIDTKVFKIQGLLNKADSDGKEVDGDDINRLKGIARKIHNITKDYR